MKSRSFLSTALLVAVAGLAGYGGFVFFQDMEGPSFTLTPDTGYASPAREMRLDMQDKSGVRSVVVSVRKSNSSIPIFEKTFKEPQQEQQVSFSFKNSGLRDGAFDLEIKVTDASLAGFGLGNTRTRIIPMRFDTQPPRITVKNPVPPTVRRGGSAALRYTVNEDVYRSGVRVGDTMFRGYQQKDGSFICFFAFPHNTAREDYAPVLMAEDMAGNVSSSPLNVRTVDRSFRQDVITITDDFLQKVGIKMMELAPNAKTPLERYVLINRDLRAANVKYLKEVGSQSASSMLWRGAFLQMPRSAARAGYADHRIYMYNGQKIDDQYHLGFDLASVRMAEIPAANSGRVVFVGQLGIYGNIVIIDHGLGVMTLYSHMSEFRVADGAEVRRGDIIGTTGSTGMAFGDHLHFGVLVGGIEVTPLEWLDPKWLRDNVTGPLGMN
ncbi:MAG: M23 family metallopeptidase [Desulfovibrionaceae bacterium]|nr:M23 family metallopeptidase [Desulfovibrionaceae bacterium]